MAIAINLLKDKFTLSEKEYQREKMYLQYAVVLFVIIFVVTIALALVSFFFSSRLATIEDEIARGTNELASYTEANAQQVYLKSRLQLITAFLDDRTITREAMQRIFSISIPGVVISGLGFESDNTVSVQMTADSASSLTAAIETLSQPTEFFTQVVSRGISRLTDGGYQVQVLLTIPRSGT